MCSILFVSAVILLFNKHFPYKIETFSALYSIL